MFFDVIVMDALAVCDRSGRSGTCIVPAGWPDSHEPALLRPILFNLKCQEWIINVPRGVLRLY
jgi:hypothetical protein